VAVLQSVRNSLLVAGTSAAAQRVPLGRSCLGGGGGGGGDGGSPRPAQMLPAARQPYHWSLQGLGPEGIAQGNQPGERFGRAERPCWAWGGREGRPVGGSLTPKGAGDCGSKHGVFGALGMYSKTKAMKLDVMLRDEVVQKYTRKHRDARPAKCSFSGAVIFLFFFFLTEWLRGKKTTFCKRDLPMSPAKWLL